MKIIIRVSVVLALVALVASLATANQSNPLATPPQNRPFVPSHIIFGDQQIPLRFFHDKHLAEDIDCVTCHENAEDSLSSSDVLVPVGLEGEEMCTNCHDVDSGAEAEPPSACVTCHFDGYEPKMPEGAALTETSKATVRPELIHIPVPNLKMNHKVHAAQGIECGRCHGDLGQIQVATRANALPLMNTCLECHDGRTAPSECRTCHLARPDGRLVTDFPAGELMPAGRYRNDGHDDGYLRNHAQTAKNDEAYCANCHQEKFCLDCHNGVARPLKIHPNNWILTHPISARRNNPTCTSCHRTQSFCTECHKRTQVVPVAEFQTGGQGQGFNTGRFVGFHPPGWVNEPGGATWVSGKPFARGPNHHSFQAQRNIRTCAACHTERTCVACHAETGFGAGSRGINPHPPGWAGSRKCRTLQAGNPRVCAKCHVLERKCE